MLIRHDTQGNALMIRFNDAPFAYGQMITDDCILRFDEHDNVVAVEILSASKYFTDPSNVTYQDIGGTSPYMENSPVDSESKT